MTEESMDEIPREPRVERHEIVERHETVERNGDPDTVTVHQRPSNAWLWMIPLLVVVLLLLWYVLSRGESSQIELPSIERPVVESPQPDRTIEIQLPERQPAQQPAPSPEPASPEP
jgi:hypothetical protein